MTIFSEKNAHLKKHMVSGLMPNLIKKSWTVSKLDVAIKCNATEKDPISLDNKRSFIHLFVNLPYALLMLFLF